MNNNRPGVPLKSDKFHLHVLIVCILGLAFASRTATVFGVDAVDRMAADRLQAVHEAVAEFKAARRTVSRPEPLRDYRVNLHVHSAFSHDSRGKIDDIVSAAKAAGTSVLMFTEHPAAHYDIFVDGHQGLRDGVLLIPGAETNGMLVYPRHKINDVLSAKPQDLSDIVRGREGLTFLSHLEERMDWHLQGLTGVEIYNTHADVKNEKRLLSSMKNPFWIFKSADLIRKYPQETFSALQDYPADYLKRWDELCAITPHTGVSANDSHQNIGLKVVLAEDSKIRLEDGLGEQLATLESSVFSAIKPIPADAKVGDSLFELRLDRYEYSLRHVGTHLLMPQLTQQAVWDALNQGRAFVAFDWIADATGFDFAAVDGSSRHEMGSQIKPVSGLKLQGESPLPAHWKLIRNGEAIAESDGARLDFTVKEAGIYRAELWLKVADEDRVWVLSNPIYIRE